MKTAFFYIGCISCLSCTNTHIHKPFTQSGVVIVPPAQQALDKSGYIIEQAFNDGGTKMVRITDSTGKVFDIYIDHRLGKSEDWGAIYVNGYPESPGSVRILDIRQFKKCFPKGLRY